MSLSAQNRESLKKVSTATLTTVLFKRGLRNAFIQRVFLLNQKSPGMVGDADEVVVIPAGIANEVTGEAAAQPRDSRRVRGVGKIPKINLPVIIQLDPRGGIPC